MSRQYVGLRAIPFVILSYLISPVTPLFSQSFTPVVQLVHPFENSEIISKKLVIEGRFLGPIDQESFMILVDGMDLTGIAAIDAGGFSCKLIDILPAGEHSIYIAVQSGEEWFEQEVFFSSRHHTKFEEFYSNNELSLNYGATLSRSAPPDLANSDNTYLQSIAPLGNTAAAPYSKFDSYLISESFFKDKGLNISLTGNLRYLDQNEEVRKPEKKGLDLLNLNLRADYFKGNTGFYSELGDIQISQSVNTIDSLARRGGQISLQYKDIFINTFTVLGKETFGFNDVTGLNFNTDENIMGVSGGINIIDNKIGFKAIYINGSDQLNSYNSWAQDYSDNQWSGDESNYYSSDEPGKGTGDVIGFILTTNLFTDKLFTEFEYDESDYDDDDSDEYASESDRAYRLLFGGAQNIYTYDLVYEYFGPFYNVPGARSLRKDYEGVTATGYMEHEIHSLNASLSGYHDNVDSDPYYSRVNSLYGTLGYKYYGFESFQLGADYAKGVDRSADEPEEDPERQLDTDIFGLSLSYLKGRFGLDFYGQYSSQNDRTVDDLDNGITTITISPVYTFESFSAFSSFSLNQSDDHSTDIRTDTYTISLDLLGSLYREQFTYELGGTWDQTKSTDDLVDTSGITGYCRLSYHLPQGLWNRLNGSVSLEANYNNREDQFGGQNAEELTSEQDNEVHSVVLSFSAALPYSF